MGQLTGRTNRTSAQSVRSVRTTHTTLYKRVLFVREIVCERVFGAATVEWLFVVRLGLAWAA
jgi:hypothetical protein